MLYTTLNKIRACSPCTEGWSKLLVRLGKTTNRYRSRQSWNQTAWKIRQWAGHSRGAGHSVGRCVGCADGVI